MLRAYTLVIGVALLGFSLVGFAEVLNTTLGGDFYHLGFGTLFLLAGLTLGEAWQQELRLVVGGLGTFMVLSVMPLFWYAYVFELGHRPVQLTCSTVGVLSILAALFLPDGRATHQEQQSDGSQAKGEELTQGRRGR